MSEVQTYLDAHFAEALEDLKAFCRIPSVSTDPAYAEVTPATDSSAASARLMTSRLSAFS